MSNRYPSRLMTGGRNSFRWALGALTVVLIAAASLPVGAVAQNNEYDLNLPGSGSSGSDESEDTSTIPVTPVAPAVTAPTTEFDATGRSGKRRNRDRDEGPTDPLLTTSAVNATAGPQEIPPLKVEADEGGVPTLALVLASLAAASCILALWRLRFLRELPAAPRTRAPRAEASS